MALSPEQLQELIILARNVRWRYELDRYEATTLLAIQAAVKRAEREIAADIQRRGAGISEWSEQRSLSLLDELSDLTLGLQATLVNDIAGIASEAGAASYLTHNNIVSWDGRVHPFNVVALSPAQLRSIALETPVGGNLLRDWVERSFDRAMISGIREEILTGRLIGESYPQLVARITSGFDMVRRDAITLVRTYVQSANVGAMEAVYQANRDVVKGVKWVATMEVGGRRGRGTCLRCAALDGQKFTLDNHPPCPLHPRCLIDGQVPIYTSKGWKKISQIQVGDLVLTHKKRFRKVTKLIFTPKQKPTVTKLWVRFKQKDAAGNGNTQFLTLTDEHPIWLNGKWSEVGKVIAGDKIHFLANRCKRCNSLVPYFYNYCSRTCLSLDITDRQWNSCEHYINMSKKISKKNKEQYQSGERDRFKQTQKANEKTKELAIFGKLSLQRPEVRELTKKRNKTLEMRIASSGRMKLNNPANNPEVRARMTESYKKTMLENPDKHPNRIMSKKGFVSSIEKSVMKLLDILGIKYEHQYPVKNYFVDIAILEKKIAIECDGEYWHNDHTVEYDNIRQKEIEQEGWVVVRFQEKEIKDNIRAVGTEISRLLANHDGKFELMEVEVIKADKWLLKKTRTLYNFSVEEDESYIANGFVVHNCRCILSPETMTWRELGLDIDEMEQVYRPWTRRPNINIDAGRPGRTILEHGFHQGDFASWFETLPRADQRAMVGPGRYSLLSSGTISFQDLVDRNTGRLRLLNELTRPR